MTSHTPSPLFSHQPFRFAWILVVLLVGHARLWGAFSFSDTSAPHYQGSTINLLISGNDANFDFTDGDYDCRGNYFTWGRNGVGSVGARAYTWLPTLTDYGTQRTSFNGPVQSLAGFSFAYPAAMPPGSYLLVAMVNGVIWRDGNWQSNGHYDEDGNWVGEDDSWNPPQSGIEDASAEQSLPITVLPGGTQPQTITWTAPPPSVLPWNNTSPFVLAATSSTGAPVRFSLGPASGYTGGFTLAGNSLSYCGWMGLGWLDSTWTVVAEAPASATHAYARTQFSMQLSKVPQPIPPSYTWPTVVDPEGYLALSQVLSAAQIWGSTPVRLQLVNGGGRIVDWWNYNPDGSVGNATISARYDESYFYEASNVCALTVTSYAPPKAAIIVTQPTSQTVAVGGSVMFGVTANLGIPWATYRWWKYGALIPGATGPTLTLSNIQASDAGNYAVVLSNASGTVVSNPAILTVTSGGVPVGGGGNGSPPLAPQITLQPVNRIGNYNGLVQLHVEAIGDPAPQYVWLRNGVVLPPALNRLGLTSNRLTLIDLRDADAGNYSVQVSNSAGSTVTSVPVTVTIDVNSSSPFPVITRQPASLQVAPGASDTLSVAAGGNGKLRYRWSKDGSPITGATSSTYAFATGAQGAQAADAGRYSVEVNNDYASVRSATALVQVGPSTSVPTPSSFTMPALLNGPFLVDLNAQNPTATNPNPPTSWSASNLPAGLSLAADTGVISGVPSAVGDYSGDYSATNSAGTASRPYSIKVLGPNSVPWIFGPPSDATATIGSPISLQVYAASGGAPLQYLWRRNGSPIVGATDFTMNIATAQTADDGSYDVVVTNANGSVTSQSATVTVAAASANGSPPTASFGWPITITRPDGTSRASIPVQTGFAAVDVQATVGDTITIQFKATDGDGDLRSLELDVFAPDMIVGDYYTGYFNSDLRQNWVTPGATKSTGNPFRHYFPLDDSNRTSPGFKTVSFVLDSPGQWQFLTLAVDDAVHVSGVSPQNWLVLRVNSPVLASDAPITTTPGLTRLVGAYFNAGQVHNGAPGAMWRPLSGRWDYRWGPNYVVPFVRYSNASDNAAAITDYSYLGWGGVYGTHSTAGNVETAKKIAAELKYSGIDFIVVDHTNLVFAFGDIPNPKQWNFENTDNCVTRAATELKIAFAADGSTRIRMAFMLGLTTAWYMDGMEAGGPNPSYQLAPYEFTGTDGKLNIINQATVDKHIDNRIILFNGILQKLWDQFASVPDVWQLDPDSLKPMLFLYVGTDGPAFSRDTATGKLLEPNLLKVTVGGQEKPIGEVFSIKYVAAGMLVRPIAATTRITPAPSGVTFPCFRELWSFREGPDGTTPEEGSNVIGTLKTGSTAVDVAQVSAYRRNGAGDFVAALNKAVASRPRILMLTAWNEFGSTNDEPNPEASWTIMPNNKYGRAYSEILRQKIVIYKAQVP